jgi:hypothetical protein
MYECRKWDWGRAVWFLGIHKSDLLCSVRLSWATLLLSNKSFCSTPISSHISPLLSHNPPSSHDLHSTLMAAHYLVNHVFLLSTYFLSIFDFPRFFLPGGLFKGLARWQDFHYSQIFWCCREPCREPHVLFIGHLFHHCFCCIWVHFFSVPK